MTRILFMHQASSIGGGSYCLLNVVKALDKKIWEPVVALKSHGPLEDELRKLGVDVVLFPQMTGIPYNHSLGWRELLTYRKVFCSEKAFEELLRRERIDVLYLNNMMIAPYLRPAKRMGCKTVIHVREHWPLDEHKKQLEWITKMVYAYCDKMIAINHYSASIFPEKEATIIYDWINMEGRYEYFPFDEIFGEQMCNKKVYLYTGGTQRIKGAYEVVKTFTEQVKSANSRLLVLGMNEKNEQGLLKKIIKEALDIIGRPTYDYIVWKMVKKDKRIKCISATYAIKHIIEQAYCVLSYFTIPHANLALAESIILGTPVIAADTEEAREYSLDGELAMLYPFKNITAFSEEIHRLDNDYESLKKRIDSKKEKVTMLFNPERNISRLNNTLKELV